MTIDQSLILFASDHGEVSSGFEWLSAQDINEALDGEADDNAGPVSASLMPPPVFPAWPRVYPSL